MMRDALLREAYERLQAGDPFPRRDPGEYTHFEVLSVLLLMLAEERQQVRFERETLNAVLAENRRPGLRVAA